MITCEKVLCKNVSFYVFNFPSETNLKYWNALLLGQKTKSNSVLEESSNFNFLHPTVSKRPNAYFLGLKRQLTEITLKKC